MSNYVRHYDVPLLDDLHNYFPEILYGAPGRFQNVQELLDYVRHCARSRFDLFSAGQRAFVPMGARTPDYLQPPAVPTPPPHPATPPARPMRVRTRTTVIPPPVYSYAANPTALGSIFNLLGTAFDSPLSELFEAPNPTVPLNGFMEPVVIQPTAEQIHENTTIEPVDSEEEVCAICQDDMEAGSQGRTLNACGHRFHIGCIDTWFQRNVYCPVCRHDVREPAGAGAGAQGARGQQQGQAVTE